MYEAFFSLDDSPFVEDEDAIRVEQGGQAVGHQDDRAIGPGGVDRPLDAPLADAEMAGKWDTDP